MNTIVTSVVAALCAATLSAQATCTTTLAGAGCGPTLNVTFSPLGANNNRITIDVSGLDPNGIGLMAWGDTALNEPVFGCFAYTNFLWGLHINPDPAGNWSWFRSWPGAVSGSYRIQVATLSSADPLGNVSINLTDCIVASCN